MAPFWPSQRYEDAFPVSNLTIGDFHNYAVGVNSILVHNDSVCEAGEAALKDMLDEGVIDDAELRYLLNDFDNAEEVLSRLSSLDDWVRPHGWRLPKNGKWSGTPGNSDFIPDDPASLGLSPADVIPFKHGMPDFSNWSKGDIRVPNLDGSKADMPKIHEAIAESNGWLNSKGLPNKAKAERWLREHELVPHHAGGDLIQLIPGPLHGASAWGYPGIRHTGGAYELRNALGTIQ